MECFKLKRMISAEMSEPLVFGMSDSQWKSSI